MEGYCNVILNARALGIEPMKYGCNAIALTASVLGGEQRWATLSLYREHAGAVQRWAI